MNKYQQYKKPRINYDNVEYPLGTSKEYSLKTNSQYKKALPILKEMGIKESDFRWKKSKQGGYQDNSKAIMNRYVFNPFRKKYPRGNNEVWDKEYRRKFNAIMSVENKHYNDWYILNNPNGIPSNNHKKMR